MLNLLDDNSVEEFFFNGQSLTGTEDISLSSECFIEDCPDLKYEFINLIGNENLVLHEAIVSGTLNKEKFCNVECIVSEWKNQRLIRWSGYGSFGYTENIQKKLLFNRELSGEAENSFFAKQLLSDIKNGNTDSIENALDSELEIFYVTNNGLEIFYKVPDFISQYQNFFNKSKTIDFEIKSIFKCDYLVVIEFESSKLNKTKDIVTVHECLISEWDTGKLSNFRIYVAETPSAEETLSSISAI